MMTATHVDGVPVVAEGPAYRKIPNGETRQMKKIVELLLEDGRTVYGCTLCDFTRENVFFGAHFSVHGTSPKARANAVKAKPVRRRPARTEGPTTADLLNMIQVLEKRVIELENARPVAVMDGALRVTDVLRSMALEVLADNPGVPYTPSTMEIAIRERDDCPEIPSHTTVANVLKTLAQRDQVTMVEHNSRRIYRHKRSTS